MKRFPWIYELLLVAVTVSLSLPVLLLFLTSFKPEAEILHYRSAFPVHWTLDNYHRLLTRPEEAPVGRWFFNSLLVAGGVTLLVLCVASLAAYALARLRLPGGGWLFGVIVATTMVPAQILLVPMYLILNFLGWIDSFAALVVPAGANSFAVFLLYQFFKGIPRELDEAAAIDGCSPLGIYFRIVLPLAQPALATVAIFTFIGTWNDFVGPLIYLDSNDHLTMPVGIALFQTSYFNDYGITLAASVLCTLPVLVLFLIFQKALVRGIAMTGSRE